MTTGAPLVLAVALAIPFVLQVAEIGMERWREAHRKGWSQCDIDMLRSRLVTRFEGVEIVGDAIPPDQLADLQDKLKGVS